MAQGSKSKYTDKQKRKAEHIEEGYEKRGVSNAQVALSWLLHQPAVTAPIVGATRLEHIEDAVKAADLELSPEEIETLRKPYVPHPVLGL